jgi:hypothetical protein
LVQVKLQEQRKCDNQHVCSNKKVQAENVQSIREMSIAAAGGRKKDIKITFYNPNTEEETVRYLGKLLSHHMVEQAIKNER